MAANHELPAVDSPEEAIQFETESAKLFAFLDHILVDQPWSGWKRLKDPARPYAFHEVVLPSYRVNSRTLESTTTVPVRFEVASEYMLHDSEDGKAKLDLLVSENHVASVSGVLRNPNVLTGQFKFLIEGRHYDYELPEREPKPLTEEARRYGIGDYGFHWQPRAMQPSHRVTFSPSGELIEASVAFNGNPMDSPIFATTWTHYIKDEPNLRAGLMVIQGINGLLEKALKNPYCAEPSSLESEQV